jgi:hypothetical protein
LHAEEIKLLISNMLIEVIETYIPHKWVDTVEPFMNRYNGRISYDYSGEVKEMTQEEFKEILLTLRKSEMPLFYLPLLDKLLSNIYIDQWVPTYVSNYGKHWVSYKDLLEEKFREWRHANFELYDEDGNELNEELEEKLDEIFYEFLENTSHEIYAQKILKSIR